jgi:hypothetical protein
MSTGSEKNIAYAKRLTDAYAYLGIPPAFRDQIERLVQSMKASIGS